MLTRFPNCVVNLFESEKGQYLNPCPIPEYGRTSRSVRQLFGKPHSTDELFAVMLRENTLYDDLLRKVSGDWDVVECLAEYEKSKD